MRFSSREVSEYVDAKLADELILGEVYFDFAFVDEDLLIPTVRTLVLVRVDKTSETRQFLFQDAISYYSGITYEDADQYDYPMLIEYDEKSLSTIFDFDSSLEKWLACSLKRERQA